MKRAVMKLRLRTTRTLTFVLVAAATLVTSSAVAEANRGHQPPIGRCTMAPLGTETTVEVQIPDAADFCELVSQALAYELFYAPMIVTPELWHYPDAPLSCRLQYRRTPDRITVHNSDAACRWLLLGLAPGWHPEAVASLLGVRRHRRFGLFGLVGVGR
jgi:hypothetical protein